MLETLIFLTQQLADAGTLRLPSRRMDSPGTSHFQPSQNFQKASKYQRSVLSNSIQEPTAPSVFRVGSVTAVVNHSGPILRHGCNQISRRRGAVAGLQAKPPPPKLPLITTESCPSNLINTASQRTISGMITI